MESITLATRRRNITANTETILIVAARREPLSSLSTLLSTTFPLLNQCVAHTPKAAIDRIRKRTPAMIIAVSPLKEAAERPILNCLRELPSPPPFLAVCQRPDPTHMLNLIRLGASGYLNLNDPAPVLRAQLTSVMHGDLCLGRDAAGYLAQMLNHIPGLERISAQRNLLSVREKTALAGIASGKTAAQLAQEMGVQVSTIQTFVRRIYTKLNISTRAEAACAARRLGL